MPKVGISIVGLFNVSPHFFLGKTNITYTGQFSFFFFFFFFFGKRGVLKIKRVHITKVFEYILN